MPKINKLSIDSKFYPEILKNIFDPPKTLYYLGDLTILNKNISIVGTRNITTCGQINTSKVTKEFVKTGYTIISGMALGVDAVAHFTAIENDGKTVAVLGAGVDVIYPPENKKLYDLIIKSGGLLISEVPSGTMVRRELFPARNRIISGLSERVVVVEAALKSGSLITARLAVEQGRDVYAVPGSAGCDYLIEQGASPIIFDLPDRID